MKRVKIIRLILVTVGSCSAFTAILTSQTSMVLTIIFGILGAIGLLGHLLYSMLYWICPRCGEMLSAREFWIEYYPHCGKKLDDEEG